MSDITEEHTEVLDEPKPMTSLERQRSGLVHFKVGNPGGPGRPAGVVSLRTILKKSLQFELDLKNPVTQETYKMSVNEAIALQLISRALSGSMKAIELIFDRMEGKVADMVQLGNIDNKPFEVENSLKYDFANLTTEELIFMKGILTKTASKKE